jgi:hypothetical protein
MSRTRTGSPQIDKKKRMLFKQCSDRRNGAEENRQLRHFRVDPWTVEQDVDRRAHDL